MKRLRYRWIVGCFLVVWSGCIVNLDEETFPPGAWRELGPLREELVSIGIAEPGVGALCHFLGVFQQLHSSAFQRLECVLDILTLKNYGGLLFLPVGHQRLGADH